jgi:hypothetical protein
MPVIDHAVHPMTQFDDTYRYGCHSDRNPNRQRTGYYVKVRKYDGTGRYKLVDQYIPNTMSFLCRNDVRKTDPNCRECKHPSDIDYLKQYGL